MNTYKQILFERELRFIPLTQPYIDGYKNLKLFKEIVNDENDDIFMDEIEYNFKLLKSLRYDDQNKKIYINDSVSFNNNYKVLKKCVQNECKGYIMSDYICGICHVHICEKCHILLSKNHICKQQDIDSIEFINNDTKACPHCFTRIHKYEGCDQAYCTQCKTAFSYSTGKIEKGRIHNPHYYEELQKINKNIDINCVDNPTFIIFNSKDYENKAFNRIKIYNILHRLYIHTIGILENKYNYNIMNDIEDEYIQNVDFYRNIWNRINYTLEYIYKEDFINLIYINYKKINFNNDIYDVISEYINIFKNILINMKFFIEYDFKNNSNENKEVFENLYSLLNKDIILCYKKKIECICDFYRFNKYEIFTEFNLFTN